MNDGIWELLAGRRNVGLRRLDAPGPDDESLHRLLAAAAQAPDHGQVHPWRFIRIPAHRRPDLGEVFVEALAQREPGSDEADRAAAYRKAFHAPCLLVAVCVDDPDAGAIATEEKLVSLGCAIQNMLLAAQALGFASGLASGGALDSPAMRRLLRLDAHERAICFIGFGSAAPAKAPRQRPAPESFFSTL
ncbi:nitroreductase family protein [Massilia sp. TN1-12]|uniref:nitroreductase family protein n=1 Tax=Massilia paldalensis TaxID=3377675 RepID=UPI00384E2255